MTRTTYRSKVEFTALQNIADENYWTRHLSGHPGKTRFPYDQHRTGKAPYTAGVSRFSLTGDIYRELIKLSSQSLPRLQMILTAGLAALLYKYTGNNDITIGTPIYKQEIQAEFINTVLPLRNQIRRHMTFKELLLQVRETITGADEHQNYPMEMLLQKLGIPFSKNDEFPLFDVVILLENLQDKSYIEHLKPNILFSFLDSGAGKGVTGILQYNASLYGEETVENIILHYRQLLEIVFANVNTRLLSLNILTGKEKKLLLEKYNNTRTDYPASKTIYQLFAEQVERTPDKIAVIDTGTPTGETGQEEITYRELNQKSDELANWLQTRGVGPGTIVGIMAERSHRLVIDILGILKAGAAYLPIDPENPAERIDYMLKDSGAKILVPSPVLSQKQALEKMPPAARGSFEKPPLDPTKLLIGDNLAYIIYTSGTTGKPKGVMIDHQGLVNYIWWAAKHYVDNSDVNFPLFTSISFDLTVTSIFTPLITGNTLVVYGDENKDTLIERVLTDQRVKVVKITPSQLKTVMDKRVEHSAVKRFILGGEELETRFAGEITAHFPHCHEVINEYGPTEATVGCMRYRYDPAKDTGVSVPLGVPADNMQIYILDKGLQPVPIGVIGEMYLSGDGIARGYLNRPELTAERFINLANMSHMSYMSYKTHKSYIYKTGDLAEWLPDGNNMVFRGRSDQQLKIRGYRIEPGEIENRVTGFAAVKQSVVVPYRDNTGETQLAAYVVPDMTVKAGTYDPEELEKELRYYLGEHLPYYMIPAQIVIIAAIPLTGSGKPDVKKLPDPQAGKKRKYTPPANRLEQDLVEIWSKVLRLEKSSIGVEDNFFELGGHSLKATILVTDIHKQLNFRISLKEVFSMPTIRGLSRYLITLDKDIFIPIAPASPKEYYELSSAQKRMYVAQQLEMESTSYNMCTTVVLQGELHGERLEKTFRDIIQRHESLRTSFIMLKKEPVQQVHEEVEFKIEYYDLATEDTEDTEAAALISSFIRPFDLSRAPLLRVGLIKLLHTPTALRGHPSQEGKKDRYLLMVDMHHIVSDGISHGIFIRDFAALYCGENLPPLNIRYVDFSEWQNQWLNSLQMKKQEDYWSEVFKNNIPVLNLPTDFPRPETRSNEEGDRVRLFLAEALTAKLNRTARENEATLFMVLLAIFNILLSKYGKTGDIVVGTPVTGRRHPDLENVIGVFINMIVLSNHPAKIKTFREFLEEVKQNTVSAFENQDYPFDRLVNRLGRERETGRNPLFDHEFSMNTLEIETVNIPGLKLEPYENEVRFAKYDLHLLAQEAGPVIRLVLSYSTALFKRSTMEKILRYYIEIAEQVVENADIPIRDIKISHTFVTAASSFGNEQESDFML